jgi:hypothetical protein
MDIPMTAGAAPPTPPVSGGQKQPGEPSPDQMKQLLVRAYKSMQMMAEKYGFSMEEIAGEGVGSKTPPPPVKATVA